MSPLLPFRKGWFDPAAPEIGLDRITPHEIRHTAAMTLHTCADYFDDDLVDVAATLNETALKPHVKPLGTWQCPRLELEN